MNPLIEEKYSEIYGQLSNWRNSTSILTKSKNVKEGILPFVTGLRFSAQITYLVRNLLENSNLAADWGHILDGDKILIFSNECDIIIYRKQAGSVKATWNGDRKDKIMDFKFIDKDAVIGVISCKSYITKSSIDSDYPKALSSYTKRVWLFAECCGPKSIDSIRTEAKSFGYKDFWSLYTWSPSLGAKENKAAWEKFEKKIIQIAQE